MAHKSDFVGIATANTIFIGVEIRAEFDKIALGCTDP
jgi:hypothetical protein